MYKSTIKTFKKRNINNDTAIISNNNKINNYR